MIKVSLFLFRREDLTHEEFKKHWMEVHWPTVQTVPEVTAATIRYVQQHPIGGEPQGVTPAPFDGVAEVWMKDRETALSVMGSDGWKNIVGADDKKFLDTTKTLVWFSEELIDFKA